MLPPQGRCRPWCGRARRAPRRNDSRQTCGRSAPNFQARATSRTRWRSTTRENPADAENIARMGGPRICTKNPEIMRVKSGRCSRIVPATAVELAPPGIEGQHEEDLSHLKCGSCSGLFDVRVDGPVLLSHEQFLRARRSSY